MIKLIKVNFCLNNMLFIMIIPNIIIKYND